MKKNHPLKYILRRRKIRDMDFDLVITHAYFCGKFGHNIPIDETRECWEHFKKVFNQNK
jgi:hypothetical protein